MSDKGRRGAATGDRLYKRIADELRAAILAGRYLPGRRLPGERELAEMFKVSRPTIREAIIALELQHLVEVRVGAGMFVLGPGTAGRGVGPELASGPFELMEARKIIEAETAALAATLIDDEQLARLDTIIERMEEENRQDIHSENADRAFHVGIAAATGNSALVAVIDDLWRRRQTTPMFMKIMEKARSTSVKPVADEHRRILAALRKHNSAAARTAMQEHLTRVMDTLLKIAETEATERVRTEISARRERYSQTAP